MLVANIDGERQRFKKPGGQFEGSFLFMQDNGDACCGRGHLLVEVRMGLRRKKWGVSEVRCSCCCLRNEDHKRRAQDDARLCVPTILCDF